MTASNLRASLVGFFLLAAGMGLGAGCSGGGGRPGYPDAVAGSGTGGRSATGGGSGITDGGTGGAGAEGGSPDDGGSGGAGAGGTSAGSGGTGGGAGANLGGGGGTAGAGSGGGGRSASGGSGTGGGIVVGTGGGGVGTGGAIGTGGGAGTGGNVATGGAVGTGNVRVLTGPALLIGPGQSCSTPATPTGGVKPDEWCGAIRPGAAAGTISLAVFNLTKAMAGTLPTCAPGDPNCLALSASISIDGPHGFFGESLIYYEAQSVFVWRPGWTAGRLLLAQDQLASCVAGPGVATAICIKLTADPTLQNLYAGRIDTQTGQPLALVEPISAQGSSASFSYDLQSVVWSTTASATTPEVLKIQTIGDAATRRTVASNVTGWGQTPDGLRWLWLSQPVTDVSGYIVGTLQTSPFPAGTTPTNVHAAVIQYAPWSNKGLVVLATPGALGGDLKAITDIDNPTASARVLEAALVLGITGLADDGTVLYFNDYLQDPQDPNFFLINLLTSKADATGKCTVSATPYADVGATLTRNGTRVAWAGVNAAGTAYDGVLTQLSTCSPRTFSTSLARFLDVGAGVVVQDNFNAQAFTAALGFVPVASDGTLGANAIVHAAADTIFMPLYPGLPRLVYGVDQTVDSGIFVSRALTGAALAFTPPTSVRINTAGAVARQPTAAFGGKRLPPTLSSARPTARETLLRNLRPTAAGGGAGLRPSLRSLPSGPTRAGFALSPQ